MFIKGHLFQNAITVSYYLTLKTKQVSLQTTSQTSKRKND